MKERVSPAAAERTGEGGRQHGIADETGVSATECLFKGDRNEIRNTAANAALFLLWKKIVKPNDFDNMVIE